MIHILDEKTINKIAAGEVVERPASVIKELVENSIDAQATSVEVEIISGGTEYMRVTDNGCGMSEEDARLAILRHATSKIQTVEDLFDISSLGFRGEALASIAAVSEFSLTTRRLYSSMGTKITVTGGQFEDCLPCGANPGTTIEVANLFFNTPARKKFLKTVRTEGSRIQDAIGKLAIAHLDVAFKLIVDGRISLVTPGNGKLMDCLAALYGYDIVENMFTVFYESEGIYVEGAVSKPSLLKSSRLWQTLIVNNRTVGDKTIAKAIDNAYHALLPKNGYPLVILYIVVPAESIDINVHPRKSEVKFANEKAIFKAVYHAVLQGLQNMEKEPAQIATSITQDREPVKMSYAGTENILPATNASLPELIAKIKSDDYQIQHRENFWQESLVSQNENSFPKTYNTEDRETFKKLYGEMRQSESIASDHDNLSSTVPEMSMIPLGQVASCYIIAKQGDDLYIIDQHAAHERVRFDRLCEAAEGIPTQELLIPQYINVTESELELVETNESVFSHLGFVVEQSGPAQIALHGIPNDVVENSAKDIFQHIMTFLHDNQEPTNAQLRHTMLAYASCRGAIKAGHNLNTGQMTALIRELFQSAKPYVCPHGRPTIVRFTPAELGKLFNRS